MDLWAFRVLEGELTRIRHKLYVFQPVLKSSNYKVRTLMTVHWDFHFREVQLIKLKTLLCAFEIYGSGGWVKWDHKRGRNVKEAP